ncbi:hypothetical protein E2P81_ATG06242 [Venturia nashicola]|nr:hypothetical protein E2P81_ATG06242 [Venturia nashicola]
MTVRAKVDRLVLCHHYSGVDDSYSGVDDSYSGVDDSYSGVDDSYSGVNDSYSGVDDSYSGVDDSYSGVDDSYSGVDNSYSGVDNSYLGFNNSSSGFDNSSSGFDNSSSGFDNSSSGFDNSSSGFDNSSSGFDNSSSGFDNSSSGVDDSSSGVDDSSSGCVTHTTTTVTHTATTLTDMNWTGGRLQRHSKTNAKTTELARQKHHFAAVRQRLQNGETLQGAAFRPSFLGRDGLSLGDGIAPFGQSSQRHTGHSKGNQRNLDDYSSTAPLAQRLSSMQKRPITSRNQAARQQKLPSSDHRRSRETGGSQVKYEAASESENPPRIRGDAASSWQQHSASRKRGRSNLGEEDSLEISRKRLLSQNDWIGLAHSRPLQMSFTSRYDKERIGKRRRVDSAIEQRQRTLGKVNNDHGDAAQPPFMIGTLRVAPESISVRIGDHALSTQVSVAPQGPARLREDVEQMRQSSESMLFDVEQHELSQPQGFGSTEKRVEQRSRPRIDMNHIYGQDVSGSPELFVCISDDTDTSEDSASAIDEDKRRLEPMKKAAIEEDLEVHQLLDQLKGRDNDDDQHRVDQGCSPILSVHDSPPAPVPLRLVFESSSDHHDGLPSHRPLEPRPRDDTRGAFTDRAGRNDPCSDTGDADATMPNSVNANTAQARQPHFRQTDEVGLLTSDDQDDDAPWRTLFSIPSSNSAFAADEFETENVSSDHDSFHSFNSSLATTRDAELKTLRAAQSLFETESSASIHISPSASFRMITSLVAEPQREKDMIDANIVQPHHVTDTNHSDHNEYWRKFIFDDEDEEDDRTTAAQPSASTWPSSSPKQNSWSAKPDFASRSSMSINTSPSDASFTFRARADPNMREQHSSRAHASASALSMKNNVSIPGDNSTETDTPVKNKTRGRSGKSNESRNKEIAQNPSPDLRQQDAAAVQGRLIRNHTWIGRPQR